MRNYGLKLDTPKPEDYIFGGGMVPMETLQPDGDWSGFLPVKEYQNLNGIEPYACVTFTILNCIEILIRQQYGIEKNYSDRFLAAISGTKEGGNSPSTVCEFLRKIGVVPQEIWPFDESIKTFEKFYEPIPPKLYELAQEFNREWDFKHEFVPLNHDAISAALKCSPLLISVSAWFERDGKYYRPEGMTDNHATTMMYERQGEFMRVFDSYADRQDDPAIKDIEWGAIPMQVKRFFVKRKNTIDPAWSKLGFYGKIWNIIKRFILWTN